MKIGHTERGFEIINFTDHSGRACSLQQSSLALCEPPGSGAIWLGVGDERMHLDIDGVLALLLHLEPWVRNGSFEKEEETS